MVYEKIRCEQPILIVKSEPHHRGCKSDQCCVLVAAPVTDTIVLPSMGSWEAGSRSDWNSGFLQRIGNSRARKGGWGWWGSKQHRLLALLNLVLVDDHRHSSKGERPLRLVRNSPTVRQSRVWKKTLNSTSTQESCCLIKRAFEKAVT